MHSKYCRDPAEDQRTVPVSHSLVVGSGKLSYHHTDPGQEVQICLENHLPLFLFCPCCTWIIPMPTFVGLVWGNRVRKVLPADLHRRYVGCRSIAIGDFPRINFHLLLHFENITNRFKYRNEGRAEDKSNQRTFRYLISQSSNRSQSSSAESIAPRYKVANNHVKHAIDV